MWLAFGNRVPPVRTCHPLLEAVLKPDGRCTMLYHSKLAVRHRQLWSAPISFRYAPSDRHPRPLPRQPVLLYLAACSNVGDAVETHPENDGANEFLPRLTTSAMHSPRSSPSARSEPSCSTGRAVRLEKRGMSSYSCSRTTTVLVVGLSPDSIFDHCNDSQPWPVYLGVCLPPSRQVAVSAICSDCHHILFCGPQCTIDSSPDYNQSASHNFRAWRRQAKGDMGSGSTDPQQGNGH